MRHSAPPAVAPTPAPSTTRRSGAAGMQLHRSRIRASPENHPTSAAMRVFILDTKQVSNASLNRCAAGLELPASAARFPAHNCVCGPGPCNPRRAPAVPYITQEYILLINYHWNLQDVGDWASAYVIQRINEFKPTAERPFVLGLPTGAARDKKFL